MAREIAELVERWGKVRAPVQIVDVLICTLAMVIDRNAFCRIGAVGEACTKLRNLVAHVESDRSSRARGSN